ncbi:hypothetical protein [Cytobacillus massiliigabonensis]|uniref:hypothetical protein n=1 Tax=Cytobacillus massiliigabonensis TaxID=1871011 RepID=UPI000C84F29B|nr:hypothetical protein [Cytobacillus massiliigabonensis]
MAQLNLLGAQRVKALTEILAEKEKLAIASMALPSVKEIKALVDDEFGIDGKRAEIDKLVAKANELAGDLNDVTGARVSVSLRENSNYGDPTAYDTRVKELRKDLIDDKIAAVKAEFKRKEQSLWLCETLEEAKAIVGIE